MLKLNRDYSDYTDETDGNYPEGKAINASSSESVDGTPLLADFMNDINAAHIAMYEKAYGNRTGISGEADTQKKSQFVDAVEKLVNDKVKNHDDKRGLSDGVHGATSQAEAGQIASRDEFGNLEVGTAVKDNDAVNFGLLKQTTAPAAEKLASSKTIDGVPFDGSANISHFGTCGTEAATQEKAVACPGFVLAAGARIAVLFTAGNTCGTCVGTDSNIIAEAAAPKLNVNNTGAATIYVGGQPAGEGFINPGEVHEFIYDGTHWQDQDATVIYKGGNDTDGYYLKERNLLIKQSSYISNSPKIKGTNPEFEFYSTDEIIIGCFIQNGVMTPIYRKVIKGHGSFSNGYWTEIIVSNDQTHKELLKFNMVISSGSLRIGDNVFDFINTLSFSTGTNSGNGSIVSGNYTLTIDYIKKSI